MNYTVNNVARSTDGWGFSIVDSRSSTPLVRIEFEHALGYRTGNRDRGKNHFRSPSPRAFASEVGRFCENPLEGELSPMAQDQESRGAEPCGAKRRRIGTASA